jgi:ectoine hydroxylase-related dioxygenase (phytanoyl-CoA dioxygenase family)
MIPSILDQLAADGWVVVDLLEPAELAQVGERIERLGLPEDHGFYASPAMAWGTVATSVSDAIRSIVEPAVARHLPHVRTFLAGVTSKGAGSPTPIPYHQDWTYCDERRWRATFFWCPLVDVDDGSGCLRVVPGSHRWSDGIRPSREREASQDLQGALERASIPVPLAAGQAIAFDA